MVRQGNMERRGAIFSLHINFGSCLQEQLYNFAASIDHSDATKRDYDGDKMYGEIHFTLNAKLYNRHASVRPQPIFCCLAKLLGHLT